MRIGRLRRFERAYRISQTGSRRRELVKEGTRRDFSTMLEPVEKFFCSIRIYDNKKKAIIRGNVYRFHERRHGHEISRDSTLSRRIFYIFLRTFEKNNGEITDSLSCINSIDLRHRENINSQ